MEGAIFSGKLAAEAIVDDVAAGRITTATERALAAAS